MPAQHFGPATTQEETDFQEKHYFQLINGTIYSAEERDVIEKEVERAKISAHFPHLHVIGSPTTMLDSYFAAMEESMHWVLIFAVVLYIGCVLSISILTMKKIHDNYRNMMIHLISGGTMRQLWRYVLVEIAILVAIPSAVVAFLLTGLIQAVLPVHLLFITACGASVIILSAVPIYIQFRRISMTRFLKREE